MSSESPLDRAERAARSATIEVPLPDATTLAGRVLRAVVRELAPELAVELARVVSTAPPLPVAVRGEVVERPVTAIPAEVVAAEARPQEEFGIFDPAHPLPVPPYIYSSGRVWHNAVAGSRPQGYLAVRMKDGTVYYGWPYGHIQIIEHFNLDIDDVAGCGVIFGAIYCERRSPFPDRPVHTQWMQVVPATGEAVGPEPDPCLHLPRNERGELVRRRDCACRGCEAARHASDGRSAEAASGAGA